MKNSKLSWFFLLLVLGGHLWLLINLQFTAWPEMLAYPYLWVKGMRMYGDFVHPYTPLLTVVLGGWFSLLGFSIEALQWFSRLLILCSDLVLFVLLKRFTKRVWMAVLGVGFYAIMMSVLDGNMVWFDNVVVLPLLGGGYFLIRWMDEKERKWLVLTGLALGLAILVKQTAGLFGLVPFMSVLFFEKKGRVGGSLGALAFPVVFLVGAVVVFVLAGGEWGSFWDWVIYYPFVLWTKFPGYVNFNLQRGEWFKLLILGLPILLGLSARSLWREKKFWIVMAFVGVGAIAVYPRWSFFHLQPALPFLVFLYGMVWSKTGGWRRGGMVLAIFLILIEVMWSQMRANWGGEVRFWQEADRKMVGMIKQNIGENDRVFLQGLPASYYALADRLPPPHWSDNFGWYLEIPGVQEWVIEGFEKNSPEVVLWRKPSQGNWFDLGVYQPEKVVNYVKENYNFGGEVGDNVEIWRRKTGK